MVKSEENVCIFLHGVNDGFFNPQEKGEAITKRLKQDGWKVYTIGYSDGEPTRQSLEVYVTKIAVKIDELGLKKISAVIGHSMGGFLACDFARSYRKYGIRAVIMLETPILGLPAWILRIWRFVSQRNASFSWTSIQNMRDDKDYVINLNKDWPKDILRFEIGGSLAVFLKWFYKLPEGMPVKIFSKVGHSELRTDPEVLDYVARILEGLTVTGYYP